MKSFSAIGFGAGDVVVEGDEVIEKRRTLHN
jgi:hypothetical protein